MTLGGPGKSWRRSGDGWLPASRALEKREALFFFRVEMPSGHGDRVFLVRMWKSYMTSPKEFLCFFGGLGGFFRFVWEVFGVECS